MQQKAELLRYVFNLYIKHAFGSPAVPHLQGQTNLLPLLFTEKAKKVPNLLRRLKPPMEHIQWKTKKICRIFLFLFNSIICLYYYRGCVTYWFIKCCNKEMQQDRNIHAIKEEHSCKDGEHTDEEMQKKGNMIPTKAELFLGWCNKQELFKFKMQ